MKGNDALRLTLVVCLSAWIGFAAGCRSHSTPKDLKPTYDGANGKLRELSYDSNKDGYADMKAIMDGTRVLEVDVDENHDGRTDRWEYYDSNYRDSSTPMLLRIERSTHQDGKITRKERFENGALTSVEEDRDGDGRIDRWEKYVDGALATLEVDTTGRGTADRKITFGDSDKWKSEKVE